jgi:hypothetical protein
MRRGWIFKWRKEKGHRGMQFLRKKFAVNSVKPASCSTRVGMILIYI